MRISTTMQFTSSLTYIQKANSTVDNSAKRYNTGLKFNTAGENPSGMASKLNMKVLLQLMISTLKTVV